MIASVLLAASVVGVSGMILSSYAHDEQSASQNEAIATGEALMEELTALPFTAGATSDVGLMDFASYTDTTSSGQSTMATAKQAQINGKTNSSQSIKRTKKTSDDDNLVGLVGNVVGLVGGLLTGGSSSNSGSSNSGSGSGTAVTPTSTTVATPASPAIILTATRAVSIDRKDTLTGISSITGDLALVTVDVTMGNGQVMRVRRLVSSTEAASTAAAANRY